MTGIDVVIYVFGFSAALSAIFVLLSKNIFYAVLSLLVCLLSLAAIYAVLRAEFLAVSQIMIYAGGVVIVILFGLMLTSRSQNLGTAVKNSNTLPGIIVSSVLMVILAGTFASSQFVYVAPIITADQIQSIGIAMLTKQALPFEISGILLLISLIAASVIATTPSIKEISMAANQLIYLSAFLFCTGLATVVIKRNAIMVLLGIELMLNAGNLNLVIFNPPNTKLPEGQIMALFVIVIAVCEAAVGMAIVLKVWQHYHTTTPDQINQLNEMK